MFSASKKPNIFNGKNQQEQMGNFHVSVTIWIYISYPVHSFHGIPFCENYRAVWMMLLLFQYHHQNNRNVNEIYALHEVHEIGWWYLTLHTRHNSIEYFNICIKRTAIPFFHSFAPFFQLDDVYTFMIFHFIWTMRLH